MPLLICPGIHPAALTRAFLADMNLSPVEVQVLPTQQLAPYDPQAVLAFFRRTGSSPATHPALRILAFSAGVVGAMGAAQQWQHLGGQVAWMLAVDGWGVPVWGSFPVYRLSHDHFTHWSSSLLGGEPLAFYADPPVAHLELWRSPQQTHGWQTQSWGTRTRTTAAAFIQQVLSDPVKPQRQRQDF